MRAHHARRKHRQRQRGGQGQQRVGWRARHRRRVGHVAWGRQHGRLVGQSLPLLAELVDLLRGVSPLDQPLLHLRRAQIEHHHQAAEDGEDQQPGEHAGDHKLLRFLDAARMTVHSRVHSQEPRQERDEALQPLRPGEGLVIEDGAHQSVVAFCHVPKRAQPKHEERPVAVLVGDGIVDTHGRVDAVAVVVVARLHLVLSQQRPLGLIQGVGQQDQQDQSEEQHA
mmetsp:Transcript_35297/g.84626  ORF Transcript_35297/g.84626 Transcript_35297/m.84626 type:complete len:225 (-) Transcript_35297:2974-3648(-)